MALVSQKRKRLNEDIAKIFLRFNLQDTKTNILPMFEEVSWDTIKRAVCKYNLSTRMSDIGRILLELMKNYTMEDAQDTYGNLMLLDCMLHHKRKTWYTIQMKQADEIPSDNDCANNMIKAFRKHAKNVAIYTDTSDNIRWFVIVICKRTKSQGIVRQKPIYLAHEINSSYVFFSPKSINADTLKILISGFGYEDLRILKLSGKHIFSLISMLNRHKNADALRANTSQALRNAVENIAVRSSRGIDYCQDKVRTVHAKEMFGDESIELQTLTVNVDTDWRGVRTLPQSEGKRFQYSVRLRSKDVRKTLEELVQRGIMTYPYPVWAKEFLISGKNVISIG